MQAVFRTFPMSIAVGLMVGALYLLWFQEPYLTYKNLPFPPTLQTVKPGQVMPLTVVRCSSASTIKSYTITHELRNEDGRSPAVIMPATLVTVAPGCAQTTSLVNLVPAATPPGRYRIVGVAIVEGALRSIPVPWSSQAFEVAAP